MQRGSPLYEKIGENRNYRSPIRHIVALLCMTNDKPELRAAIYISAIRESRKQSTRAYNVARRDFQQAVSQSIDGYSLAKLL